jgi:predicted amidohydrolase
MIGVNRCGGQDENDYNGHSAVIDPMGEMIAMGRENECIFTAEINLAVLHQVRKKFPFLGDIKRENR